MSIVLGLDTSNYTTSCAAYDAASGRIIQRKRLLPVKSGEAGLRQSDAVFHHTKQLPELMESLFAEIGKVDLEAVAASNAPRTVQGSYMPCFLVGEGAARSISAATGAPIFTTSHQIGHILAALYSADKLSLLKADEPFLAFHVSGGTTDLLLCTPHRDEVLKIDGFASSLDLKAGQAVDRVGLMLGLDFPCGKLLEKLAENADRHIKCKPVLKEGSCCLSGLENICARMLEDGETKENIAAYCLDFIGETISEMTEFALTKLGSLSIVYAGGVMSDGILQRRIASRFDAYFAAPEFSCDNAAGVALFGALKKGLI